MIAITDRRPQQTRSDSFFQRFFASRGCLLSAERTRTVFIISYRPVKRWKNPKMVIVSFYFFPMRSQIRFEQIHQCRPALFPSTAAEAPACAGYGHILPIFKIVKIAAEFSLNFQFLHNSMEFWGCTAQIFCAIMQKPYKVLIFYLRGEFLHGKTDRSYLRSACAGL